MKNIRSKQLVSDLLGSKIVTAGGKVLGHVADLQLTRGPEYRVTGLIYGIGGWLFRLHVLNPFRGDHGERPQPQVIPWDPVESFEHPVVKLKRDYESKELHTDS
jgi:sporulation protein YlmC with PRC-barrel domain